MQKKSISTYLSGLSFNPKLSDSFIAKYLTNIRLVLLLLFIIIPAGIVSMITLPRRLNPEVKIPIVVVTSTLPGAGPEEIESLITIPIEDSLESVEDVDVISSQSQESVSVTTIQFLSTVDIIEAKNNVQSAIDGVTDLPEDASTPSVTTIDFENIPVISVAISTTNDSASLFTLTEEIEEELAGLPDIDRVEVNGIEDTEIQIEISPEKISQYGISPFDLSNRIKSSLASYPAGSVVTSDGSILTVSIDPTINSIDDIRELPISLQNVTVPLSSIASVWERSSPNQLPAYIVDSSDTVSRSVTLSVFKSDNSTISDAAAEALSFIEQKMSEQNGNFSLQIITNNAKEISDQFSELGESFTLTLALVFVTLFMFLGIRQSLIVALSIPITILISFTVMGVSGLTLNFLSVFSLLLALGLLVDDAIVIVSALTMYMRADKFTPKQAGLLVWKDFIVPIWSTTITTVWAFLPLLLATGIIGEFIKTIPIVVSATLIASTSVAVLVTLPITMILFELSIPRRVRIVLYSIPLILGAGILIVIVPTTSPLFIAVSLLYMLLLGFSYILRHELADSFRVLARRFSSYFQKLKVYASRGIIDSTRFSDWYKDRITSILKEKAKRRRVVVFVVIFAVFSYLLVPLGFVVNEFFPAINTNQVFVSLKLPTGTSEEITKKETLLIAQGIADLSEVEFVTVEIGRVQDSFGGGAQSGTHTALFTVTLYDETSIKTAERLREITSGYPRGELTVSELSGGPPVGNDLVITYLGQDFSVLNSIADETVTFLENLEGVDNVQVSISPSTSKLSFVPDEPKLAEYRIGNDQLGFWLRTYISGFPIDELRREGEQEDITLRVSSQELSPNDIGTLEVQTPQGTVPLAALGRFELTTNPTSITREDGQRTISISADVTSGSIPEKNQALEMFADELLPQGYERKTGGVNEENAESLQSIFLAMSLSAVLILATMVIQLGSYRKALIILMVIPLAVSGVFILFAATQTPLSFPALIGVLALFGIVVNNSIVVVEKINQNLSAGIQFEESIADAAASRVEPIMFSSLTTIIGLVPITITDPLWRGLGGAIIAGLSVSGAIMLFFIPVIYYMWFKSER